MIFYLGIIINYIEGIGEKMKLAIIGLGKMGANMAHRLILGGHEVIGIDRSQAVMDELSGEFHLIPGPTLEAAIQKLDKPRICWLMLPAGDPTESVMMQAADLLAGGDILIDGGNSNFKDSIRRGEILKEKGIHFLDVGVSGGVWGLKEGYSMMIGGDQQIVEQIRPIFTALAPGKDRGWGRVGPNGAGHYTKMVHNGIEYGLMEAYAEGFELMRAHKEMNLDLYQISQIWDYGSVVRSWLLELFGNVLQSDPELADIRAWVADSGEGRWTVMDAIDQNVPAPVITLSLMRRIESRQEESYAAKLLAAVRNQFGGHAVLKE
jgi:6-phosphogluconate dehydrogenase